MDCVARPSSIGLMPLSCLAPQDPGAKAKSCMTDRDLVTTHHPAARSLGIKPYAFPSPVVPAESRKDARGEDPESDAICRRVIGKARSCGPFRGQMGVNRVAIASGNKRTGLSRRVRDTRSTR
ncbi:hypothetical protein SAMN05519103_00883 [Rhizobiales bacterium GAS113]|nr:hypothetical protein SAMN05519103_00883 [Rhizobiales bacterium GAS113]